MLLFQSKVNLNSTTQILPSNNNNLDFKFKRLSRGYYWVNLFGNYINFRRILMNILFFCTLIIYTPSSPPFPSFFFAAPSSIFIIHKENHVTYVETRGLCHDQRQNLWWWWCMRKGGSKNSGLEFRMVEAWGFLIKGNATHLSQVFFFCQNLWSFTSFIFLIEADNC